MCLTTHEHQKAGADDEEEAKQTRDAKVPICCQSNVKERQETRAEALNEEFEPHQRAENYVICTSNKISLRYKIGRFLCLFI